MNQIQMWQLLVDIGLITSVLTMTARAFKSSRLPSMLPKTRELEASLRGLIGDAETAGLQLNDQLLRREQNIQRALSEIQQSEARITKAIAEAEALQGKLQQTRVETIKVIQDLKSGFERGIQSERARIEEQSAALHSVHPEATAPVPHAVPPHHAPQAHTFVEQTYTRTPLQRNIEVTTATSRVAQSPQGTAAQQPSRRGPQGQPTPSELQKVYKSAEVMLKEGQPLESVADQMKLPVEGVRLLAQMIEIERDEDTRKQEADPFPGADARLGALAAIRRQTSVL
ncbi:MAG: hypothetical protein RIS36_1295 [Pseudomonadota bacterium]